MREYGKSALRAAIDGMREVFSAVIVIGIVLVAVFVPVAFFPGITGRMYQQFSITIACAVILSVFNAVTFTPALSALLLDREHKAKGRFFTAIDRAIDRSTHAYVHVIRVLLRREMLMLGAFALAMVATWWIYRSVPSSFVPNEDEGYFITILQAPAGASLQFTEELAAKAERIILNDPDVLAVFSVAGFSFSGSAPNQGLMFTRL
jgi:HAE1 family hydrophobic/amphiphilic exporter-1